MLDSPNSGLRLTIIGESQDAHEEVYQRNGGYDQPNEAKFSHELVAGAASFEGMKLFEDHQRKEGQHHCKCPTDNPLRFNT